MKKANVIKIGRNWSKEVKNVMKLAKDSQYWSKIAKIGQQFSKVQGLDENDEIENNDNLDKNGPN